MRQKRKSAPVGRQPTGGAADSSAAEHFVSTHSIAPTPNSCQVFPSPELRQTILEYTANTRTSYWEALAKHDPVVAAHRGVLYAVMLDMCEYYGIDPLEGAAP